MTEVFSETWTIADESCLQMEDGGDALVLEVMDAIEEEGDECMFVRIQSWDETAKHQLLRSLVGKQIKITIETIGE